MTHHDIFKIYKQMFPQKANLSGLYFKNGKNGIRVKQTDGSEYSFVYNSRTDWRLETLKSFLNNKRGA